MSVRTVKKRRWIVFGVGCLLAIAYCTLSVVIYTDYHFYSRSTMSSYGYREWPLGVKTNHWSKPSALQEFLITESVPYEQIWTKIGTGRNAIGDGIHHHCGKPNAAYRLRGDVIRQWIDEHSREESIALHDLLLTDDFEKVRQRVSEILDGDAPASA